MKRQVFYSPQAPKPKGPYSQAIIHDEILYVSGQGPVDPATGAVITGTIQEEARITLNNIRAIIEEAGYTLLVIFQIWMTSKHLIVFTASISKMHRRQGLPFRLGD